VPDSKLSQKDFDRWRVRLKHARDVWTEKGIIGNSQMSAMRILLEMYRGNHWGLVKPLLGLSTGELVTINKVFSGANTLQAQVAARDPEVQVFPRSDRAVMSAPKAAKLVNYDIEELNFMRQWNASLRDHFFAPIGICRHGFTPDDAYIGKNGKLLAESSVDQADPDVGLPARSSGKLLAQRWRASLGGLPEPDDRGADREYARYGREEGACSERLAGVQAHAGSGAAR